MKLRLFGLALSTMAMSLAPFAPATAATKPSIISVTRGVESATVLVKPSTTRGTKTFQAEFTTVGSAARKLVLSKTPKLTVAGLTTDTAYRVRVRERIGTRFMDWSAVRAFRTVPAPASDIVVDQVMAGGAELRWVADLTAASFNVLVNGKTVDSTTEQTYTITGLASGTYDVAIVAVYPSGISSAPVSTSVVIKGEAVTTATDPAAPGTPVVTVVSPISVVVAWTGVASAVGYDVALLDSQGNQLSETPIAASTYTASLSALKPASTYGVKVSARYASGEKATSAVKAFKTTAPYPSGITVSDITKTGATLRWTPVPGAYYYEIIRNSAPLSITQANLNVDTLFMSIAAGAQYSIVMRTYFLNAAGTLVVSDASPAVTFSGVADASQAPSIAVYPAVSTPKSTGIPYVGATLTATRGGWTSVADITSYALQWQWYNAATSTWTDIAGATSSSYTVQPSDLGRWLRILVVATSSNGSSTAWSNPTSAVQAALNTVPPVITGTATVGQTLQASTGTWESTDTLRYSYQWIRGSNPITTATSATYTLTDADVGYAITVAVTARTASGLQTIASAGYGAIVAAISSVTAPAVTGTPRVGSTLSVSTGTWLNSPGTYAYQWQTSADGVNWYTNVGTNASTFTPGDAETGRYVRVIVAASKTISSSTYQVVATSNTVGPVTSNVIGNTVAPTVSGIWAVGSTLTASSGSWTLPATYTYQWQRSTDGSTWSDINGATASTYALVDPDDDKKFVRVRVRAAASGLEGTAYSAATAKVGAPYCSTVPTVSGTVRIGVEQTVANPTCTGTPTFTYQWQQSTDGIYWQAIANATAATFTPTYDLAANRVRVAVTATNGTGATVVTSAALSGFLPPLPPTAAADLPVVTISNTSNSTTLVADTLSTTSGTWPSTSDGYTYQWQRSNDGGVTWTNIADARTATYVITSGDLGYSIRAQVSVSTATGTSIAYSTATAITS